MEQVNDWQRLQVALLQQPGMIANLQTSMTEYQQDGFWIPATVNDYVPGNCYVVSPLALIVDYARDEIIKIDNGALRALSNGLTLLLKWPLLLAHVDRLQVLNNQCLSTNITSSHWQSLDTDALRQQALQRYPQHTLMIRSLNGQQTPELLARLSRQGWLPIVSHQVYCLDDPLRWWGKINACRDDKLLHQMGWEFKRLSADAPELMQCAERLYNQLYLDKYSRQNVQFTAGYLSQASQMGVLQLYGLFHQQQMVGVLGMVQLEKTVTVPIVGYRTELPASLALYRRLIAFALRYAMDRKLFLNLSSGAPDFKRVRGCQPEIEYSMVYVRHLNVYQRSVWAMISWLSRKVYQPLLRHYQL
ncbi:GNAT family N-acetyltransferase [Serratia fonticola]|uniref:GNAT family N-acetyltransferase n=1 Tax=Serratia fonticola TaxID=47917 RepID=A0AAW3WM53_SERFO|nr:GNAT family N-acetyltransferase [Serratia fonticola]MBC3211814.1 GNAT family N-acetyltransferase [Serratia fonticola]NYA13375.1 GNAT family N-acetyltransferase [Serratia fonticola]NYA33185.1 GNAT family N-acetyltransferase [Serratia fonticola]